MTRKNTGVMRAGWFNAGVKVLLRDGYNNIKLKTVQKELGVTTGSFYNYFSSFNHYLKALAEYIAEQGAKRFDVIKSASAIPEERLSEAISFIRDNGSANLFAKLMDWAESDVDSAVYAKSSYEQSEEIVLQFFISELTKLGFSECEAGVRAIIAISLANKKIDISRFTNGDNDFFDALSDLLLPPAYIETKVG